MNVNGGLASGLGGGLGDAGLAAAITPDVNQRLRGAVAGDVDEYPGVSTYPKPSASAVQEVKHAHNLHHTNPVIEAGLKRSQNEVEMQNLLQRAQFTAKIYNSEIEPEHDVDWYCSCLTCTYRRAKWNRRDAHKMWSKAVKYPGESTYSDMSTASRNGKATIFSGNPYFYITSPYGYFPTSTSGSYPLSALTSSIPSPKPDSHAKFIKETLAMNAKLNRQAQEKVDRLEPKVNIWGKGKDVDNIVEEPGNDKKLAPLGDTKPANGDGYAWAHADEKAPAYEFVVASDEQRDVKEKGKSVEPIEQKVKPDEPVDEKAALDSKFDKLTLASGPAPTDTPGAGSSSAPGTSSSSLGSNPKRRSGFLKLFSIKSSDERAAAKTDKSSSSQLRQDIIDEEAARWPDAEWLRIVDVYQVKTGMKSHIAEMRLKKPLQYLHLLRAGYFEPIPVAWANMNSSPLKFSIEPAGGWRGITPQWRGYEDTAEERLYWVLNHREEVGDVPKQRLKPDFISAMDMARARMESAVEPPPQYFSSDDTCYREHKSDAYSKQVLPAPFHAYDRPQVATDDTMILLDVSGSMDFNPVRPVYNKYLITGWANSPQPKNKSLAKAIVKRFIDAMTHHDMSYEGYDLVTFENSASYIGKLSHLSFEEKWGSIRINGGTRVMTGWQKVKELHFKKHSESATYHPVLGWQAGPLTPMLRLLLLLDGEATDMDEFELDLLGLDWAHITIFLIGVDGCPHHHRHANELQRISDVNHHVSFVDAQGNTPERFVTHELLKRHLGYDVSMHEFEEMEVLPTYSQ